MDTEKLDNQYEREEYRMKCKHFLCEEICAKKSGGDRRFHVTWGCDGNCRRMKNYDKKHANNE